MKTIKNFKQFNESISDKEEIVDDNDVVIMDEYEETEPDYENDCFIEDTPSRGYNISCSGKSLENEEEMSDALKVVSDWMEENNWYPTIWFVSDHGNMWAIDREGNEIK